MPSLAAVGADIAGKAMPAPGLGVDVRIEEPGISAAALVHDGRVLHLSASAA